MNFVGHPTAEQVTEYCRQAWVSKKPPHANFTFFQHYREEEGLFLDIGAHAGQSVAYLAQTLPRVSMVAFEPNPLFQPCRDFLLAQLPGRLTWYDFAVGAEATTAQLHVPRVSGNVTFAPTVATPLGPSSRASLSERQVQKGGVLDSLKRHREDPVIEFEHLEVPVKSVDALGLLPRFAKIDVEGFEFEVLQGMRQTLARSMPILMIEKNEHEPVIAFLESIDYQSFSYIEGALYPFHIRPDVNDIFFLSARDVASLQSHGLHLKS